jgi:hypothetical protein
LLSNKYLHLYTTVLWWFITGCYNQGSQTVVVEFGRKIYKLQQEEATQSHLFVDI